MMADHSDPDSAALLDKATGFLADRLPEPALAILTPASIAHPAHAGLAARHADALQLAGRLPEAVVEYRRALALDPDPFEPWYGLGSCLVALSSYGAAIEALSQALQRQPDHAAARGNLAEALFQTGSVDAAVEQFRHAARDGDAAMKALLERNVAIMIPGSPLADNAVVLAVRRAWSSALPRGVAPVPKPREGRKLRIAYVSAYFGGANWMKPVFAVINRHDRTRFEVHMIADGGIPTAEAGYRDHEADAVWRVRNRPNASLAAKIAEVGIDVLIDLSGYSTMERLGLFALRPAPVQLGWFNMFATTGTEAYDALIGDASVLPPEEEVHYSEPILRVPGSYLAFEVPYAVPDVVAPPCLQAGFITFGSLCSAIKLTDPIIAAWARILEGAPTARLLLRHGTLEDASNQALLRARFAAEGIGADRLTLEGGAPHQEFLATYGRIDIALDTFPYNGGTTTTEALWQGVPVLTFNGDRWASRTSRSLLVAAGMDDWVAEDADAFVAQAIALAADPATPARLAAMRVAMRDRLLGSAVCDTAGLCAALEAIYEAEFAKRLVAKPA